VKRLVGMPGDHIHLHDGTVFINGVAQSMPKDGRDTPVTPPSERDYVDEFPSVMPTVEDSHGALTPWVVELPNHMENGDLVVPPGKYFMMGDHRHASALLGICATREHHGSAALQLLVVQDS
jgi:signal peptidase I